MLFTFGKYWKFLLILMLSWLFYAFYGFEITMVSLMAAILGSFCSDSKNLF